MRARFGGTILTFAITQHSTVLAINGVDRLGKPAYEAFWYDVEEARADGRYKYKAVPLFIDDATTAESVASDREPLDTEVEGDLNTNDEDEAIDEYDAEDEQDEA